MHCQCNAERMKRIYTKTCENFFLQLRFDKNKLRWVFGWHRRLLIVLNIILENEER